MTRTGRIARKGERITFQKSTVEIDQYQNHRSVWADYFSCFAYASTYEADEAVENATTTEERSITFSCRYCPELDAVTSTGYRILFRDEPYNILSVDPMNYDRQEIRFRCRREPRS